MYVSKYHHKWDCGKLLCMLHASLLGDVCNVKLNKVERASSSVKYSTGNSSDEEPQRINGQCNKFVNFIKQLSYIVL